jgi:glutathione S-transferase
MCYPAGAAEFKTMMTVQYPSRLSDAEVAQSDPPMPFTLYYHPLSSYCQKVLIALYENDTPFTGEITDVVTEQGAAAFRKIWGIGKFPVLRDEATGCVVPESSIIIEYLQQHAPGRTKLVPEDPYRALDVRQWDRFFDLHVSDAMQKVMGDRRRPAGATDPYGVARARENFAAAYGILDAALGERRWAASDDFSMADCAAAPALFYANMIVPFGVHRNVAAYFDRLKARPSYARVLKEAEPYLNLVPR